MTVAKILTARITDNFMETNINDHLKMGWNLYGNLVITDGVMYQVMVTAQYPIPM